MQPAQKIEVPPTIPPQPVTIPQSLADKAIQQTQTQLTDSQKTQDNLISKQMEAILGMNAIGTESGVKQQELNNLGYQQKLQDYNNLNSQILQKQAELNKSDIELIANMRAEEKRDTLLPFAQMGQAKLQGDAAIMRALKTSEIGVLNAQVLAKQGDIQMAQQIAQDAVDAKFAPYKQQIQTYTDLLKAIEPILTRDEKKQANEQQIRTQIVLKEIDKLSTAQSNALSAAISNNAPQSVLNAINSAQTIDDITKVGSQWIMSKADKLDQQLKQAQINKLYQEIAKSSETATNAVSKKDLPIVIASAEDKINKIQGLLSNKKAINASSGILKRASGLSTSIRDWRADVKNVLSDLTVDELGRVKANGVTFGALSEGERKAVGDAASALNAAADTDKNGKLTGYFNISEKKVKEELGVIEKFAKIDFERRTGMSYDNYEQLKNQKPTEESYVDQLLSGTTSSPFNVFEQ